MELCGAKITAANNELGQMFVALPLPDEWKELDVSALSMINFTQQHLLQIYKIGKLTPIMVQESIDAFAFDLRTNKKEGQFKSGPLNFFIGILRKGPYLPSENYESPEEKVLREYVQQKKIRNLEQQKIEQEAREICFNEWEKELTDENVLQICDGNKYAYDKSSMLRKGQLISYFQQHVWPVKKEQLLLSK